MYKLNDISKNRIKLIFFVGLLILLDQCIKLYIYNRHMNSSFNILFNFVNFAPKFNTKYSWINNLFDLGIGKTIHILVNIGLLALIILVYSFIGKKYNRTGLTDVTFIFIIAGSVCSLTDKLFWNGSLDYIRFKGLFTFDLKDVYITVFEVIIIAMIVFNYKNLSKIDDKKVIKDFINYIAMLFKKQ